MARRNPMNARYQKNTQPAGKTRRSAAAAKPKRDSSIEPSSAKKSSDRRAGRPGPKKPAARQPLVIHPPVPEYKKWRRIWWIVIAISMVLAASSFLFWRDAESRRVGTWVLAAAYAFIAAAIYIDMAKIRPIRQRYTDSQREQQSGGKKKAAEHDSSSEDGSSAKDES